MRLNSGHLQKLEALVATGMPGAYKVLIFFLIQYIYDLGTLGTIASWQSIAQIVGFFTAIGWSSLVLVRVAKAETKKDRVEVFNSLSIMGFSTLLVCASGILIIGVLLNMIEEGIQIIYWATAWTFYQIPRHYLIALRVYRKAIAMDVAVIGLSICTILMVSAEAASVWLAFSMMAAGLTAFILIQRGSNADRPNLGYEFKGLEFGLANFLSGGVSLSLIPLAAIFESEAFVGIFSLFISTMGIALLIPRAISLNQLPKLAKIVDLPETLTTHIALMRRQISLSNILTSTVCLAIGTIIILRLPETLSFTSVSLTFLLIILQNTLSTQGLIDANILTCREKSRHLLKINIVTSTFFFIITMILIWKPINHAFTYICLTTTILSIYRLNKTRHYANSINDSHAAL
ncbi:hypothetical protein [Pseudomonas sp. GV085]|uniref:hypothetical protein n=1 Tax=Pseudomonas sp. GV085 TaxID=2135756 RepID=UPI000D3B4078|nr:hypothetical protein [Pseudomonas sp. GV085]PTR21141.1 hypothetical protein C8K63_115108 [Pseudomonas sp. GV085]